MCFYARIFIKLIILISLWITVSASLGDRSLYFQTCLQKCYFKFCHPSGSKYGKIPTKHHNWFSDFIGLTPWPCVKDCEYKCMHQTVKAFRKDGLSIPQFYGKWPFIRFLGLQEPASVLFSILNLIAHVVGLKWLYSSCNKYSPMFRIWFAYGLICVLAWLFSTVFHAKDNSVTEILDYSGALLLLLTSLFALIARVLHTDRKSLLTLIGSVFFAFFLYHTNYMINVKFDYSYNMKIMVLIGLCNGVGWIIWSLYRVKSRHYIRKCIIAMILLNVLLSLELLDFPPLYSVLDAHALWHAGTAPVGLLWFRFVVDDIKYINGRIKHSKLP